MTRKNTTIQDIAKTANVSKSTVSRVLNNTSPVNEEKREAVLSAMKKLNFKPNVMARGLAGGFSMTLGIVTQDIISPFFNSLIHGVIQGLLGTDYSPIVIDGQWKKELEIAAIKTLTSRNVDGLMILGGRLEAASLDVYRNRIPLILVARQIEGWENSVLVDNMAGGKTATEYLIAAGHQRIAHIMGMHKNQDAMDRYEGYRQALTEANLEISDDLTVAGDFGSHSGYIAMETLLQRKVTFTAVFVSNDDMAFGARLSLYRRGIRIPEEISMIGFDDQPYSAYMTPPLTTVAQPGNLMGITAAKMLLQMIKGKPFHTIKLPTEMVIRETVATVDKSLTPRKGF